MGSRHKDFVLQAQLCRGMDTMAMFHSAKHKFCGSKSTSLINHFMQSTIFQLGCFRNKFNFLWFVTHFLPVFCFQFLTIFYSPTTAMGSYKFTHINFFFFFNKIFARNCNLGLKVHCGILHSSKQRQIQFSKPLQNQDCYNSMLSL